MFKVSRLFQFCIIFSGIGIGMFISNPAFAEQASDIKLVKITPEFQGENLKGFSTNPGVLIIKKNSIVTWMNGVPVKEVQVVFNEEKTCRDIFANPHLQSHGFFSLSRKCFVTSFVPYGDTSTLQFTDVGSYKYKVLTEDGKMSTEGEIVVEN